MKQIFENPTLLLSSTIKAIILRTTWVFFGPSTFHAHFQVYRYMEPKILICEYTHIVRGRVGCWRTGLVA